MATTAGGKPSGADAARCKGDVVAQAPSSNAIGMAKKFRRCIFLAGKEDLENDHVLPALHRLDVMPGKTNIPRDVDSVVNTPKIATGYCIYPKAVAEYGVLVVYWY